VLGLGYIGGGGKEERCTGKRGEGKRKKGDVRERLRGICRGRGGMGWGGGWRGGEGWERGRGGRARGVGRGKGRKRGKG